MSHESTDSIPASSFAAAAAALALDNRSFNEVPDSDSSISDCSIGMKSVSERSEGSSHDDRSNASEEVNDVVSARDLLVKSERSGLEDRNSAQISASTEIYCLQQSSTTHAIINNNEIPNNSPITSRGDINSDSARKEMATESNDTPEDKFSNNYINSSGVTSKEEIKMSHEMHDANDITDFFESDSTVENHVTNQQQSPPKELQTDDKQHPEDTQDNIYNPCSNYPRTPSSFDESSASYMQTPRTATTTDHPPKPVDAEQSSLLARGMSLFGRTTSTTRRYNEMDASSVVSDLSHDVKSVKSSTTLRATAAANQRIRDDARMQQHLEESGLVLVKRLVEFLSECPLAPEEEKQQTVDGRLKSNGASKMKPTTRKRARGLTLPASAVGWISDQIANHIDDTTTRNLTSNSSEEFDCYQVPKQQLQCLHTLLGRVTSLRITNDPWPPPLPTTMTEAADMAKRKTFSSIPETSTISSKLLSKFTDHSSAAGNNSIGDESGSTGTSKELIMTPFQRYFHQIQHSPDVDMRLFPYASKVVVDGIPPNWITHLDALKNLDMFHIEKGCILDVNQLFFPSDSSESDEAKQDKELKPDALPLFMYKSLTKLCLSNCAMSEAAGLRGKRMPYVTHQPKRIPTLSRFPSIVTLNLSHNELFRTKTALTGLSSLPFLSSINLSYNRLSCMDEAFMYIGNVKELILSGNEITSAQGLDRLFSLEILSLDENKIQHLANISGLAKLPFLMNLDLKGNPLEVADPESCRIEVFNMFREVRCKSMPKNATYRDMQQLLPVLDQELATKDELVAIKNLTFRQAVFNIDAATDNLDKPGDVDSAAVEVNINVQNKGPRPVTKMQASRRVHCRIASSVLYNDAELKRSMATSDTKKFPVHYTIEEIITSIRPTVDLSDQSTANNTQSYQRSRTQSSFSQCKLDNVIGEESGRPFFYTLPSSIVDEADHDVWNPIPVCDTLTDCQTPNDVNEFVVEYNSTLAVDETEDLSKLCSPLSCEEDVISPDGASDENYRNMYQDAANDDKSIEAAEEIDELKPTKSLFEGIWEQSYRKNVASSSVGNNSIAENSQKTIDYNEEELNATYDGPPDYSSIFVASDLDLYFDSYVFPRGSSEDDSQEEPLNKDEALPTPRIQLFQFDRNAVIATSKNQHDERYIGVWREDVLACGSFARSRLQPIKMHKRGFHGEVLSNAGKDILVSESRKIVVCLSNMAFYLIADDDVTPQQKTSTCTKRPFPSRIPSGATFGDAYWPHALIRHSLESLAGITIGFQFQRLIIRFSVSNSSGLSFEYTYVLLTSNKLQTISLLQKLQSHANDAQMNAGKQNAVLIENDDKAFLDALGAKTDEVVLHYQILHQLWKRGDRAAARRAFVLTDSAIYLLDETYDGDGSNPDENIKRLGDISLVVIDSASLNRVTEVRAANKDPRMITLVILPLNKLKRSHRWRLICNDGDGAEHLIDDVRKAIRTNMS